MKAEVVAVFAWHCDGYLWLSFAHRLLALCFILLLLLLDFFFHTCIHSSDHSLRANQCERAVESEQRRIRCSDGGGRTVRHAAGDATG